MKHYEHSVKAECAVAVARMLKRMGAIHSTPEVIGGIASDVYFAVTGERCDLSQEAKAAFVANELVP